MELRNSKTLIRINDEEKRFTGRDLTDDYKVGDCPTEHSSWDCARPIAKRIEPTIEECGNVVTYTWEEK